jgi:TolB-like protein
LGSYAEKDAIPAAEKVRRQLQRILDSPEFHATRRQREFLQFVVTETIAGRASEIKGYTIATRVFGRKEDFDQALDPIVSIQAGQLRRALERYYIVAGSQDPIRIDIPKGTYVPVFHRQDPVASATGMQGQKTDTAGVDQSWPTVLVLPFQNLTDDPKLAYLGIGLATDLAMEITRYQEVRVILKHSPEAMQRRTSDTTARFIINGSVQKDRAGIRISAALVDTTTGIQIWGDAYQSVFDADGLITFQEEIAKSVAGKITCEAGIISRALAVESKHKSPNELKTYDAILRYYEFNAIFTAGTFFNAYEALKSASEKEPECGLVWSMLARLYAVNYSLELFDLDTPIEAAFSFAARGVKLEPANQRARLIMAFILLLKGDIDAGIAETERSYRLNPNSLLLLENIGYLMTLLGDWERGPALINEAIKANPYYSVVAHYALWVDWIRQEEYRQAYTETLNFRQSGLFWDPLMKAAACGLIGNLEEGRQTVDDLLALKPDFSQRGLLLIRYYIKFDDIFERIIGGLRKLGLDLHDE